MHYILKKYKLDYEIYGYSSHSIALYFFKHLLVLSWVEISETILLYFLNHKFLLHFNCYLQPTDDLTYFNQLLTKSLNP